MSAPPFLPVELHCCTLAVMSVTEAPEPAHCVRVFLRVFACLCYTCLCRYVGVSGVCVSHCVLTSSKTADWIRLARITHNSQRSTELLQRTDHSFTCHFLEHINIPQARVSTRAAHNDCSHFWSICFHFFGLLINSLVKMPKKSYKNACRFLYFFEHLVRWSNCWFVWATDQKPKIFNSQLGKNEKSSKSSNFNAEREECLTFLLQKYCNVRL